MNPKYLLDTNVCICLLRGGTQAKQVFRKIEALNVGDLAISTVTTAELAFGAERSGRQQEKDRVVSLLSDLEILPFCQKSAWIYGQIREKLASEGNIIGAMDLLIAATAIHHDIVLVTHNIKEFSRIEPLNFEDWEV